MGHWYHQRKQVCKIISQSSQYHLICGSNDIIVMIKCMKQLQIEQIKAIPVFRLWNKPNNAITLSPWEACQILINFVSLSKIKHVVFFTLTGWWRLTICATSCRADQNLQKHRFYIKKVENYIIYVSLQHTENSMVVDSI